MKILLIILFPVILFSQTAKPCYILTGDSWHDSACKSAFNLGYGNEYNNYYEIAPFGITMNEILDSAKAHNCNMVLYSYTGASEFISLAKSKQIIMIMPTGANDTSTLINTLPSWMILTGAGDTANETAKTVEFFDTDIIDHLQHSSYSNYYIAGKIARLMDLKGISITQARYILRQNKSYSFKNGYGKLDLESAMNYILRNTKIFIK